MKALFPLFPLLLLTGTALASNADFAKCRSIADPATRLACYDALDLATVNSKAAPQAVQQTPEQFGMEQKNARNVLDSIESHIPGRLEGWRQNTNFRLANGQVWQVSEDGNRYVDLQDPKVTVRRGMLGAFYLEIEGTNFSPKVKRVR